MSLLLRSSPRPRALTMLLAGLLLASTALATGDRCLDDPTDWWWYHDQTAAQIDSTVTTANARIVDIEIDTEVPLRFAVSFVRNTGPYERESYWFQDQTPISLAGHVASTGGRVVDLERYQTVNGVRYSGLLIVDDPGQEPDGWWYYFDQTHADVSNLITANNMRLIDIESHLVGADTYYDIVGVRNTGAYLLDWWWLVDTDTDSLNAFASANDARILDMDVVDDLAPTFDAILVDDTGANERVSWWYWNLTESEVDALTEQNGARIIDVEPYCPSGIKRFAVLMIGNLNDLEAWMADALDFGTDGATGFYLKEVGGPVLAGLQEHLVFEPASAIKVIHHFHAMREIDLGHASLSDTILYTSNYSGSCPIWGPPWVSTDLEDALTAMMVPSDNAAAQGIAMEFGEANIEDTANLVVGMADTELNHTIGCVGQGIASPNHLTLHDAGLLYEGVADGSLLSSPTTETMWSLMQNQNTPSPWFFTTDLQGVVNEEAVALGIPQVADDYWSELRLAWKGGAYDMYLPPWRYSRALAGWVSLPSHAGGPATEYVFGLFIDGASGGSWETSQRAFVVKELFRDLVHDALVQFATSVESSPVVASGTSLQAISPNPFASTADVSFSLVRAGTVRLNVYDVRGRNVVKLFDEWRSAGQYRFSWNGRGTSGVPVPAGIYFVRLVTEEGVESRKVTCLR